MSDDQQATGQKSWWSRISQAFSDEPQTKDDLLEILREAQTDEIIDGDALSLIEGAMQVSDMQAREIMVPRSQIVALQADANPLDYSEVIIESAHSRYPVIGDSKDEIVGILLAKDLLTLAFQGELSKAKIRDFLRQVNFIPESKRLNQLLKEFKDNRNHMAIVVDEYGGVAGLVTIEDVLEQIVGEIEDEHDVDEAGLIKCTETNEFSVKAHTTIEDFNQYFNTSLEDDEFDTIGGLVLRRFGHLPKRGEKVSFDDFDATVLNADNRKIRLLKIKLSA
jgi:magnesium and cobalt transporter